MTIEYTPLELIDKISKSNFSYSSSYVKKVTESDAHIEKLQEKADAFRKNLKAVKRYSPGGISRDLLETQMTDLLKSYNDMEKSANSVTDKDVQKQLSKLKKLFSDKESELKKIGIEKVNGQYVLDTKTFGNASDKAINAVFVGHDSFIGKTDKIMRKVDETTDDAQYNTVEYKINRKKTYQETDIALAGNMSVSDYAASTLTQINNLVQTDNIVNNNLEGSVQTLLQTFAAFSYSTASAAQNENAAKLNQLLLDNKDKLADVGLTFDSAQEKLLFDQNTDMTTTAFKTAYNELFGKNAAFVKEVSTICNNTFNEIIQPDKIGVSIIDMQA